MAEARQQKYLRPQRTPPELDDSVGVCLDFDGTLVDIASTPDGVVVPSDLVPLLIGLREALGGALAIISGRSIADIDWFLAPARFIAAGGHGAELRATAEGVAQPNAAAIAPSVLHEVLQLEALAPGVRVEPKGTSVAVHFRNAPKAAAEIEARLSGILANGPDHLELSVGRKVYEIVPRHVSKGTAIDAIAELPAFRGRRLVMIGDDITDESAFAEVERRGGVALRVFGETFSAGIADFDSPQQVRAWLANLSERPPG